MKVMGRHRLLLLKSKTVNDAEVFYNTVLCVLTACN